MVRRDVGHLGSVGGALPAGALVHVRTRFDGGWASGFDVAEIVTTAAGDTAYRLRRAVDGSVLPVLFSPDEVIAVSPFRAS